MGFFSEQSSLVKRFYQLTIVSMLSNMMVPLAGLFDSAFLGHLDVIDYLGGVVLGNILFDYLYRVLKFLRSGTTAITAQAVGEEDEEEILLAILRSSVIALGLGLIILLLQYPIEKIGFTILSGAPLIESSGIDYFRSRIWGAPAVLLNFVFIGWFLGREKKGYILGLSLVANLSNVLLDYLFIWRWGWGSTGAGLATAISQYLGLVVALFGLIPMLKPTLLSKVVNQVFEQQAFKSLLTLKGNLLIRFLVLISVYAIFTNLSAAQGRVTLAANGVLLQIALLSQFTIQGVGMTTQSLIGNLQGNRQQKLIMPVLKMAIATSLVISLGFALTTILFPTTILGIITNHREISLAMEADTWWLLPLLTVTAIVFMLEAYFIGLKQATILRNGVLGSFVIGFMPLAIYAGYIHSNSWLWAALTSYMTSLLVMLLINLNISIEPMFKKTENLQ